MSAPDLRDPRLDDAYRSTPREQPSAALNERIRAAARRAVGARPESLSHAEQRRFFTRWRVPLSIAATVVVAVTLTYMVQEEARPPSEFNGAVPSAPPAMEAKTAPAQTDTAIRDSANAPAPAKPAEAKRAQEEQPRAAAPAAPPPSLQSIEERRAPAAPSPPNAQVESAPASAAAAPAQGALKAPAAQRDRAANQEPARSLRKEAAAAAPVRTPEEWLDAIRDLKAKGRTDEAAAELAAFRTRYPNYVLPADLTAR
jgi:hypothetical protein